MGCSCGGVAGSCACKAKKNSESITPKATVGVATAATSLTSEQRREKMASLMPAAQCSSATSRQQQVAELSQHDLPKLSPVPNWQPKLSKQAAARRSGPFKVLVPFLSRPDVISLAGGLPTPSIFPFEEFTINLRHGGGQVHIEKGELATALQYSGSYGTESMAAWAKQHIAETHAPQYANWRTHISVGSTDALFKTCSAVIDEGDVVFAEEYTYQPFFNTVRPIGGQIVSLDQDENGMIPESLEAACARAVQEGKRPRMVYVVPIGQNPTGATLPMSRKVAIYKIAQKYDLIIAEDDAYFFLQLPSLDAPARLDAMPGLFNLPTSMLAMDVDGRVVRFDTFSKSFGPGLRLGILTGHATLIEKIILHHETNVGQPNGIAQVALEKMLRQWGREGLHQHLCRVQLEFHQRRRFFLNLLDQHLTGLATWTAPVAGMFVWIRLLGTDDAHPIVQELMNKKVLTISGHYFSESGKKTPRIRVTFALASEQQMTEAIMCIGKFLREKKLVSQL